MDATEPVLRVRELRVSFGKRVPVEVVHGLDLDVAPGEVVAVVGESGSGKSVTALSVIGLLPDGATATGSVELHGRELLGLSAHELRKVRGAEIALISQDPVASLNPVFTIGFQVIEAVRSHDRSLSTRAARRRAIELLELVDIPDPARRMKQYPHELSGGQCQRVGIAMALASDPQLLIADEPTTALDVTVQAEVLDVLARLGRREGRAILLITHDMGVVAELADRVVVMRHGELVETGTARSVLLTPTAGYTRQLLDAVPRIGARGAAADLDAAAAVLEIDDLVVAYGSRLRGVFRAVDGVSMRVQKGEILGLVGESGSGKSTIGRAVIGAAPVAEGTIRIEGVDMRTASRSERRRTRRRVGVVFQNPALSLNPRYTARQSVEEPLHSILGLRGRALNERVEELLESVGLSDRADRYPHELSGGQCQRVGIAMALASDPQLLIADEPTTALDVTVQAEVLDVLARLGRREGRAILLITHDMGVVAELADRVVVMRHGERVEEGTARSVLLTPSAGYTRQLLDAVPRIGSRGAAAALEEAPAVLEIDDLVVTYGGRLRGTFRAVDGVSMRVQKGEILGLVGESGSGKSTIGRAVIGAAPVSAGTIRIEGVDMRTASRAERRRTRRRVGVVFQNPALSLNPRYTARQSVEEPLHSILGLRGKALTERVDELLESVELSDRADRYPHELSGGQKQRVAIARAVSLDPALLIADEPTSALDVSVQAQVLEVFRELQSRLAFACVFISHDLAVIDELCDSVMVLNTGRVVEAGSRTRVLEHPEDPYTRRLLAAAPVPDPDVQQERRAARLAAIAGA